MLERAVELLKRWTSSRESRLRLEARYRHVLVDEFQDTSRAQWELVAQLVRSWGEGFGAASDALPPSIFIVGDRKQSIYGFRDADVAVLDEAARLHRARCGRTAMPRQAITVSFRAVPALLAFVNDVFAAIVDDEAAGSAARRVPVRRARSVSGRRATAAGPPERRRSRHGVADGRAARLHRRRHRARRRRSASPTRSSGCCRARRSGIGRPASAAPAQPADIAILFRSRDSHREFEAALERRGVPTYVYKGLGFFDADEIQDAVALLRYLADPLSDLRAAALLRSRARAAVGRRAWRRLGSQTGRGDPQRRSAAGRRGARRRRSAACSTASRAPSPRWLSWVDRLTPSELLDAVLRETAYAYELRGPRRRQARENLKKLRGMIRRTQNRGYATLARIADHLERLAVGDESNAAIDAVDAVSLMTVHAAKGLEFPIVFVVNMGRGTGGPRAPIRVGRRCGRRRRRWRSPTTSRKRTKMRRRASARRPSACCMSR